jgi:hypothetical protein
VRQGSPTKTTGKNLGWSVSAALGAGALTVLVGFIADATTSSSHGSLGLIFTVMAILAAPFVAGGVFLVTFITLLLFRGAQGSRNSRS